MKLLRILEIKMNFKTTLQPHQIPAVEKLSHIKVGALYMEMGTGKTRTALDLIQRRLNSGKVNYILWLCPCSVKSTIQREIQKHVKDGLDLLRIEGIESLSGSIRLFFDLYQLVQSKHCFLVVDESNLIKNHRAIRTQRIEQLAGFCQYKLILNGTPISKCEKDLFSQWKILDWRILGYKSFWSFSANHLEYDPEIRGRIVRTLNTDYLVRKIAPYTYQVKKDECLELPKKQYQTWYFDLTDEQREEYEIVKDKFLELVYDNEPSTIYRLFTAVQHVVSGRKITSRAKDKMQTEPMFTPDDNPRLKAFLGVVERCPDEKIIVWCKYTHEIHDVCLMLRHEFGQGSTVEFYGEVSRKDRQHAIDQFRQEVRFFVANKTCAGYGLNLQFCHIMIYYSNDWDWATRSQSEDRVHRIGQDRKVFITDICADRTIDERILQCLSRKERLSDEFKKAVASKQDRTDIKSWLDGVKLVRGKQHDLHRNSTH
jgi:SNF2 family DNA or RNA helicase